jgi:DNA helicase HerA-like ATPase
VTLYIDEAQSFVGGALTELMAESRKFAVSIVLASQTLGQLAGRTSRALFDVVLSNVGNLFALRLGIRDAELLAPWFRPYVTIDDLVAMRNFRGVARMLQDGAEPVPQVVDLLPLPPVEDPSAADAVLASSRARHCRARDEVEADISQD